MKPITIKEAEAFDIKAYNSEQEAIRKAQIDQVVQEINKIICVNIEKIKLSPVNIFMPVGYDYQIIFEACNLFVDFTVAYSHWSQLLSIKMAEHEWNWPKQNLPEPPVKRQNIFQRLFS